MGWRGAGGNGAASTAVYLFFGGLLMILGGVGEVGRRLNTQARWLTSLTVDHRQHLSLRRLLFFRRLLAFIRRHTDSILQRMGCLLDHWYHGRWSADRWFQR